MCSARRRPRPGAACPRSRPACLFRLAPGSAGGASSPARWGSPSRCTAPACSAPARWRRESRRAANGPAGPVLVSVFLDGGAIRSRSSSRPRDADYRRLRPTLALPAGSGLPFAEDDRLRWHPALAPLAELHAEGKVSTLPAVGYTKVDQSHFTSRHYWEVGATSTELATGWLGRHLDQVGVADNPIQGLALDGAAPALAGCRARAGGRDRGSGELPPPHTATSGARWRAG